MENKGGLCGVIALCGALFILILVMTLWLLPEYRDLIIGSAYVLAVCGCLVGFYLLIQWRAKENEVRGERYYHRVETPLTEPSLHPYQAQPHDVTYSGSGRNYYGNQE